MSDSPIERWSRWLGSLSPEIADELSLHLFGLLPDAAPPGSGPAAELRAYLEARRGSSKREAGLAICVSALTDVVTRTQADPQTWSEAAELLAVLDHASEDALGEDVGELLERARLRTPFLSRQWKAALASWERVRATELAPETITRWLRSRRVDGLRPR